ncbi:MAG: plasmid pRiA4b ORF-3 family protein [Ruminococcus sp.]|nr:plasmid pRiA4b ORF-3 family protein [Ruminococcus sp.]
MKARINIPKKTYVISVSLMKGCYRHIQIASNKTLEELSQAILDAFDFCDDHLHAFFMDNKLWSDDDSYYADAEDGQRDTSKYKIGQLGLEKDKKFVYLFDFGDEWDFSCKVLKVIDGVCEDTEVVRSVGEPPVQYPELAYDDDDGVFEPYPDSLYAAAFRFRDTKLWKKLKKEDIFAVKLSDDDDEDLLYCSVTDDHGGFPALLVFHEGSGLHEYLKPHVSGEGTPKEYMEYICFQEYLSCELQDEKVIAPESKKCILDYAERNGVSLNGKNCYPLFAEAISGCFPLAIEFYEDREYLENALDAAVFLSKAIGRKDIARFGFGKKDTVPMLEYDLEKGYTFSEISYPEPNDNPYLYYPSTRKLRKKLPHKGVYECDIVFAPVPVPDEIENMTSPIPYAVTFLAAETSIEGEYFHTDLFDGYDSINSEIMLSCVVDNCKDYGVLPEEMRVVDKRTYYFLLEFCQKNDIKLTTVEEFEIFEDVRSAFINDLLDQTEEEFGEKLSAEDMYNEICDAIRELSEEQLATMPKEMYDQIMASDLLPDDLQAKLRRSRIRPNKGKGKKS